MFHSYLRVVNSGRMLLRGPYRHSCAKTEVARRDDVKQGAFHACTQEGLLLHCIIIWLGCHSEHVACMGSGCGTFTRDRVVNWPSCAWVSCSSTTRLVLYKFIPRAPLAARIILPQFVPIVATLHPIKLRREVIISGHIASCITSCRKLCGIVNFGTSMLYARDCTVAARRLLHTMSSEVKNDPA